MDVGVDISSERSKPTLLLLSCLFPHIKDFKVGGIMHIEVTMCKYK